jgi:hypothetical protein
MSPVTLNTVTSPIAFGKSYPHAVFTAVIYGHHRSKFGTPETSLRGKRVCVKGQISDYHGKPEIVLAEPRIFS